MLRYVCGERVYAFLVGLLFCFHSGSMYDTTSDWCLIRSSLSLSSFAIIIRFCYFSRMKYFLA